MSLHRIPCSYMEYHVATWNTMSLHRIPCSYIEYHVKQFSIELVACEWTLVMGSNGLLSWDRMDSCHWIDWSLVMGSIGVLSWDQLDFCHGLLGGFSCWR